LSSRIMGLRLAPCPDTSPHIDPIPFITRRLLSCEALRRWLAEGSVLRVRVRILSVKLVSTS
jgi:hypothetical protein